VDVGMGGWVGCEVKTKGFIKPLALGWIGGQRDGYKGGVWV
jgi:hypothetical protein